MDWLFESKDVLNDLIQRNNEKQSKQNGFSYTSVAALALVSVFGHFTSNFIEGQKQNVDLK